MQNQRLVNQEKRHLIRKLRAHEQACALAILKYELELGMTLKNTNNDGWVLLLEDASSPNHFRYQCFDALGFASHHTFNTLEEALTEAFNSGYRYKDDSNVLDRLSKTNEWNRGMAIQAIRDKYNSGKIDWNRMLELMREMD